MGAGKFSHSGRSSRKTRSPSAGRPFVDSPGQRVRIQVPGREPLEVTEFLEKDGYRYFLVWQDLGTIPGPEGKDITLTVYDAAGQVLEQKPLA